VFAFYLALFIRAPMTLESQLTCSVESKQ